MQLTSHLSQIIVFIWIFPGFLTWVIGMVIMLADEKNLRKDIQFFRTKNIPGFIIFFLFTLAIITLLGWISFAAFFIFPDDWVC